MFFGNILFIDTCFKKSSFEINALTMTPPPYSPLSFGVAQYSTLSWCSRN